MLIVKSKEQMSKPKSTYIVYFHTSDFLKKSLLKANHIQEKMKKKSAGLCQLLLSQPKHYLFELQFPCIWYGLNVKYSIESEYWKIIFVIWSYSYIYSKSIIGIFKITFFVKKYYILRKFLILLSWSNVYTCM